MVNFLRVHIQKPYPETPYWVSIVIACCLGIFLNETLGLLTLVLIKGIYNVVLFRRVEKLKGDLYFERVRLASCSVAALGNTLESKANRIDPNNPYYSASYGDVCRAVDREIEYREALGWIEKTLKNCDYDDIVPTFCNIESKVKQTLKVKDD